MPRIASKPLHWSQRPRQAGACTQNACEELAISLRTYQRWSSKEGVNADGRPQATRSQPANKLSEQERRQILDVCNQEEYSSLAPSQIVPKLADKGIYVASEASFYRVLKEADQLHYRGKAQAPRTLSKPKGYQASAPNQVWSWDITYVATTIVGVFFRLYLRKTREKPENPEKTQGQTTFLAYFPP